MLEIEIEEKVCKWAEENGWFVAKLQWLNQTGWPDRTFIKNGIVSFVEFKRPGGYTSKKQDHWIEKIREHGGRAAVFSDAQDAIDYLVWLDETYGD